MKCPKCGYLGFEPVDRCRNCGYEFSLSGASPLPELSLKGAASDREEPLVDLALIDAAMARSLEASHTPSELPLFGRSAEDDAPLIARPSAPRPPLAVRRPTPDTPRVREPRSRELRASSIELPLPGLDVAPPPAVSVAPPAVALTELEQRLRTTTISAAEQELARPASRVVAALIDLSILGMIDVLVIYLTMKICGLSTAEFAMLPKAPLAAFLVLQNLSYFVAFTAGGQTLGKMSTGIKVVTAGADAAPDLAHAFKRSVLWAVLALPAGLGFLSALLSSDRRGLHDRVADTRVVRVTA